MRQKDCLSYYQPDRLDAEPGRLKSDLPEQVRGFIPKLVGYALRFAGANFLMHAFEGGETPGKVLSALDISRGIQVSQFYLGHIIEAMEVVDSDAAHMPFEVTAQVLHLGRTLESIRDDVDHGKLAIGHIQKSYNTTCEKGLTVKSPHLMGVILRQCRLTVLGGRHRVKTSGVSGAKCLQWDEKVNKLIEICEHSEHSAQQVESIQKDVAHNSKAGVSEVNSSIVGSPQCSQVTMACEQGKTEYDQGVVNNEHNEHNSLTADEFLSGATNTEEFDWSF